MKTALTELEESLLHSIVDGLYAEYGYTDMELSDISKNVKRDRGVLGSLVSKGIVRIWENRIKWGDPVNFDGILITDQYIQACRDYFKIDFWRDFTSTEYSEYSLTK